MTPDPISPPSDGQPSSAAQGSDQLLDEVYTRLDHLVASSGVEDEYIARLRTVLSAALASERAGFPITLLPLLTCRAAGTAMEPALPVAAAWRALLIAAKLLDDVEDGDVTRMSADTTNPPQVINLATGFLAIAGLALSQLPPATWFVL
ncbi:MAG TPA: hypothetical protein VE268_08950, partial [Herpetosiphonaceae bacterium]|nr:hypothetical protein [Herpetosiphonaceae bacterium]